MADLMGVYAGFRVYILPRTVEANNITVRPHWWLHPGYEAGLNRWLREQFGTHPEPNPILHEVRGSVLIDLTNGIAYVHPDDAPDLKAALRAQGVREQSWSPLKYNHNVH